MSNPYDLEAIHRGGNIAGPSGQLFKPTPNAADKAYEHDIATAERRGEQRILRDVAKLPMPVDTTDDTTESGDLLWRCAWCDVRWAAHGWSESRAKFVAKAHPDNGCLWPRAQAAQDKGE